MRDDLRRGSDASTCFVVEKSRQQRWTFARGLSAMNHELLFEDAWSAAVRMHRKPARRLAVRVAKAEFEKRAKAVAREARNAAERAARLEKARLAKEHHRRRKNP